MLHLRELGTNERLGDKEADIQEYFRQKERGEKDIYYKLVKAIQKDLSTVIVYYITLKLRPSTIIGDLLRNNMSSLNTELKHAPFKTIPCSALLDLHEYVELLTLQRDLASLPKQYQ